MANYSVTTFRTSPTNIQGVLSELETKIETIDTGKTIRLIEIREEGSSHVGVLIYDA